MLGYFFISENVEPGKTVLNIKFSEPHRMIMIPESAGVLLIRIAVHLEIKHLFAFRIKDFESGRVCN